MITTKNLEESLGEGGDDIVVTLNQGKAVSTYAFSFFSLLNLDEDDDDDDDDMLMISLPRRHCL